MNTRFSLHPRWIALVAGVASPLVLSAAPAWSQKKTRPARGSATLPVPASPAPATSNPYGISSAPRVAVAPIPVNVLILAMDDVTLTAPPSTLALPASGAHTTKKTPLAPRTPSAIRPIAPASIAPMAWPKLGAGIVSQIVVAKKKPKVDPDATIFKASPQEWSAYPTGRPALPAPPPSVGLPSGDGGDRPATQSGDGAFSPNSAPNFGAPPANGGLSAIEGAGNFARPTGAVEAAAAPLRRALLRAGFQDVLSTPLDGSAIQRLVNSRHLSLRVLNGLRNATKQWLATMETTAPVSSEKAVDASSAAPAEADLIATAAHVGQVMGYRAVIVMALTPHSPAEATLANGGKTTTDAANATYSLMMVDAQREAGEALVFDQSGDSITAANDAAAASGAALITKNLIAWPVLSAADKKARADKYFADARLAIAEKDYDAAQDSLNQVMGLDPNRAEAFTLLGDILQSTEPGAALSPYRVAASLNDQDGEALAKLAIAYTIGPTPQWPRALEAGEKALALQWDTAALRQAMATAQLGRARLFHEYGREESAATAEAAAREHLDRALVLAPDDPGTTRIMTQQLLQQGRTSEALQLLDRVAVQYPDDSEIQNQYAEALLRTTGRDENAFTAWAHARKLSGEEAVPSEANQYRRLSNGFDLRISNIGKRAGQLADGVAHNTVPREAALMQMGRFKDDLAEAAAAIKTIPASFDGQGGTAHASRVFAADTLVQALETHQLYLETGQQIYLNRANELHRLAIVTLNATRTAAHN